MVKIKINNIPLEVEDNITILSAARKSGIDIPTLCFLKDLNEISACKVCVVEIEGNDKLSAACTTVCADGMNIFTNSPKVRKARKTNVELILSQHDCKCATCVRSGNCSLQKIANDLGITKERFEKDVPENNWPKDFPFIREESKCIKCMRCIQVCDKIQSLNIWDIKNTGERTTVGIRTNQNIKNTDCSHCGQCVTHCPVGALHERDDVDKVYEALSDKEKVTIIQVAPAVRTAWVESLGFKTGEATEKQMVTVLKEIGFDYVFDTNFSADLTIMEEGNEFLKRLPEIKESGLPMFTSCCPAWVRFMKSQYPEYKMRLSSAKSPQQMFGAIAKTYFAEKIGVDPRNIFCVSIMPCTAKKGECAIPSFDVTGVGPDVDVSLTTRELTRLVRADHINVAKLKETEFDSPLGEGSGAAVIFGATGGVMEAALRTAVYVVTGKNPDLDAFKEVRGIKGRKEVTYNVNDIEVRTCTVSGLGNARALMEDIKAKKVNYDFVEIMACPGGCAGGGGQPIVDGEELAEKRSTYLYDLDKNNKIRFSHENKEVQNLYKDYLVESLGEKSHHLLHVDHNAV